MSEIVSSQFLKPDFFLFNFFREKCQLDYFFAIIERCETLPLLVMLLILRKTLFKLK